MQRLIVPSIIRRRLSSKQQFNVFDRDMKKRQKEWSFKVSNSNEYDYLREECAKRVVDRLEDITRSFPYALELGCHRGHIYHTINKKGLHDTGGIGGVETLIQCDDVDEIVSWNANNYSSTNNDSTYVKANQIVCDPEVDIPFDDHTFDLVISSLDMHWINDLPSTLSSVKRVLKPDGVFIGSMLGGNTLHELRHCFYLAEQERRGRLATHASPFALASDVAGLIQAADFQLPTIDVDTIEVSYDNVFTLLEHLQKMGEGTAAINRQVTTVGKDTMMAMASLYQELYGLEDGSIPATFQVIYMIGWSPHSSQPKACKRGSAKKSLKDI